MVIFARAQEVMVSACNNRHAVLGGTSRYRRRLSIRTAYLHIVLKRF